MTFTGLMGTCFVENKCELLAWFGNFRNYTVSVERCLAVIEVLLQPKKKKKHEEKKSLDYDSSKACEPDTVNMCYIFGAQYPFSSVTRSFFQ